MKSKVLALNGDQRMALLGYLMGVLTHNEEFVKALEEGCVLLGNQEFDSNGYPVDGTKRDMFLDYLKAQRN